MKFISTYVLGCLLIFVLALLLSEPLLHSWQAHEMGNQGVAAPDFADIATSSSAAEAWSCIISICELLKTPWRFGEHVQTWYSPHFSVF